jgi:hypothetical protein
VAAGGPTTRHDGAGGGRHGGLAAVRGCPHITARQPRAAAVWGRRRHGGDGELKGGAEWRARTFFGDRCVRN